MTGVKLAMVLRLSPRFFGVSMLQGGERVAACFYGNHNCASSHLNYC